MRLLSINVGPDCSATVLKRGEVTFHLSAERISRKKHDENIFEILEYLRATDDLEFSDIIINDTNHNDEVLLRVEKFMADHFKFRKIDFNRNDSHLSKAYCGFFNSSFDKALCFVSNELVYTADRKSIREIFKIDRDSIGPKFSRLAQEFGFEYNGASKIMNLSQCLGYEVELDPKWREMVDRSYDLQRESESEVIRMIEKYSKETGINNIVLTGGYALNCVANSKFKKEFPHLNFFIDPLCSDSIGQAYKYYKENSFFRKKIKPLKKAYIGTPLKYDGLDPEHCTPLHGAVYEDMLHTTSRIIGHGHPVAIAQGRSEGGYRALGNRSILLDPRRASGKEFLNNLKGRENFRPFGATILQEYVNYWFDFEGESSHMQYVAKRKSHWNSDVITHVDGTCCIQTLTKEQNYHYYRLIEDFYYITGVPMVLNTSLNYTGEPIAETLDQIVESLVKLGVHHLYLPEEEILVKIH